MREGGGEEKETKRDKNERQKKTDRDYKEKNRQTEKEECLETIIMAPLPRQICSIFHDANRARR